MTNNFNPKKSGAAERPQLSPEEYVAKKKAEKDAVYQMIDDAATEIVNAPEKFRGYLDTQARMDRYSAANALLIYKQQPQATQLKDFRDWQEDGVKVNKGAKSLSILEPVEYTKNDGSTGIAYNVKKVFDVAQTSGKKPAAPTLDRDPRKLVAIMLDTAPIDVSTVEELPSPNMGAFYKNEDQPSKLPPEILIFRLPSMEYEDMTAKQMYAQLKERLSPDGKTYLFLDEVQEITGWEKVVNSLASDFDVCLLYTSFISSSRRQRSSRIFVIGRRTA